MRLGIAVATLAAMRASGGAARESVRVEPVDVVLPLHVAKVLPACIPACDVCVTDDFCFYDRRDGRYHFPTCVG